MAILKCKMCGGNLDLVDDSTVIECEYCGTKQTVPTADNEKKMTLFARANRLRSACEFDKAAGVYESIVAEFPEEAEAYWGLVLCKYGIEYVDDPATGKKIPTCHRSSFDSIMDDSDFEQVMENADSIARRVYREEAKTIEEIRKGILEVSSREEPYDIFICYKETDENDERTIDSVIAQDIYDNLTEKGYRVFFARISLEDKLGTAYEPYIFAALNSAKIMLAVGTDYDYYNAVWVKNEWSRFLALIAKGEKKTLIPCYKGIDAYDIPKEFKHLQAQDMGKVGAMQDLLRGIGKLLPKKEQATAPQTVVVDSSNNDIQPLLKRMFMYLEDGEWDKATEYSERVLDKEPENAETYLGKLMVDLKVRRRDNLKNQAKPFDYYKNYQKAIRFGDDSLKNELNGYIDFINKRNAEEKRRQEEERHRQEEERRRQEKKRIEEERRREEECRIREYNEATEIMNSASTESDYKKAAKHFRSASGYKDADDLAEKCKRKADSIRNDSIYSEAAVEMRKDSLEGYTTAKVKLKSIKDWKDANDQLTVCETKIKELISKIEEEEQVVAKKKKKRIIKISSIFAAVIAIVVAFVIVLNNVIIPNNLLDDAKDLANKGNYLGAIEKLNRISDNQTAKELSREYLDANGFDLAEQLAQEGKKSYSADILMRSGLNDKTKPIYWELSRFTQISAGDECTVGLKTDGTVVATKYTGDQEFYDGQCDVTGWKDIIAISTGYSHTVGLKSDGTVVATKYIGDKKSYNGKCDVENWTDIVAIAAGSSSTVGLKADGTVVAVGGTEYSGQCSVWNWINIVAIAAGSEHTVGLKSDGTVVAVGDNDDGQCDVEDWTDIVAIAAGDDYTVGLKSDGTVVATKYTGDQEDYKGQCDVEDWTDIVAIAAGDDYTVGLKLDGTVVATEYTDKKYYDGKCDVENWTDIVAISTGYSHTVGLKSDGKVVTVGSNYCGKCDANDWKLW